jgi:flagellar motility protein MotE (MotC chaperone)
LTIYAQQESQKPSQPQQQPAPTSSGAAAQSSILEEERLNILRSDIKKELQEYQRMKQEIEAMRKEVDKDRLEQQLKVAKMYESMPPEDAAKRLEKVDEESALLILSMLKPKVAGKILAQMDAEKAALLSRKMLKKPKL